MTGDAKRARDAVLGTFEWIDGNASFTPVFRSAETLQLLGAGLAEPFRDSGITAVMAPEARGFILGALCAASLGVGFVAARKPGELRTGDRVDVQSDPDWRGRRITFSIANVLTSADRVLIVDDWIETGSQAKAVAHAISQMGATLVGTSVIVDQAPESIRAAMNVVGLLRWDELPPGG